MTGPPFGAPPFGAGLAKSRPIRVGKVGLAKVGQLRLAKVGQIFLAKVGLAKVGFGQSRKIRMAKVGLAKVGLSRQCRPQLSHGVNKLQSVCGTATLDDLTFANKLLQEAKESSDDGLFFKSELFTRNKMEMLTITDASFGNESNFRSRKRADDFSHWT